MKTTVYCAIVTLNDPFESPLLLLEHSNRVPGSAPDIMSLPGDLYEWLESYFVFEAIVDLQFHEQHALAHI